MSTYSSRQLNYLELPLKDRKDKELGPQTISFDQEERIREGTNSNYCLSWNK